MNPAMPPSDSIEHFATVVAWLDDGLADPQAVLRTCGLDRERWEQLVAYWSTCLARADGGLVERFGAAYAAARRRLIDRPRAPTAMSSPPLAHAGPSLASTIDVDWSSLRAAVPFQPSAPGSVCARPATSLPSMPRADVTGTLPIGARLPVPVLPFAGTDSSNDLPPGSDPRR